MIMTNDLIKAKKTHFGKIATLIAETMCIDPINKFYFENEIETAKKELKKLANFLCKFAFKYGHIYTTEKIDGVCMFLNPNYPRVNIVHLLRFNHLPSLKNFNRATIKKTLLIQKATKDIELIKKQSGEHWYIQLLCVQPSLQKKGFGSILMQNIINIIKKENSNNLPIFLETTNPENLPFYEKNEFTIKTDRIIDKDLHQYLLVKSF
jgi:ribosomal protein S18 acetylase RimI-like enzyme